MLSDSTLSLRRTLVELVSLFVREKEIYL